MEQTGEIVNKVAAAGLINLDLKDFYKSVLIKGFDIEPFLFEGFALREKDFRAGLDATDFSVFEGAYVHVFCSADAILPQWAYMLVTAKLSGIAKKVIVGNKETAVQSMWEDLLSQVKPDEFQDKRVIVKGCSEVPNPEIALVHLAQLLNPKVKSLMFGEACSTVPIFKRK